MRTKVVARKLRQDRNVFKRVVQEALTLLQKFLIFIIWFLFSPRTSHLTKNRIISFLLLGTFFQVYNLPAMFAQSVGVACGALLPSVLLPLLQTFCVYATQSFQCFLGHYPSIHHSTVPHLEPHRPQWYSHQLRHRSPF